MYSKDSMINSIRLLNAVASVALKVSIFKMSKSFVDMSIPGDHEAGEHEHTAPSDEIAGGAATIGAMPGFLTDPAL